MPRFKFAALALLASLCAAPAYAAEEGVLTVKDGAGVFSEAGVEQAKEAFAAVPFRAPTSFAVVTYGRLPDDRRAGFDAARSDPSDRGRFFQEWAKDEARAGGSPDVLVLIVMEVTHVQAVTDRRTDVERGFTGRDAGRLADKFVAGFKSARGAADAAGKLAAHDAALTDGAKFVATQLRDTALVGGKRAGGAEARADGGGGSGLMGYLCIGVCVLLGVWVVVGLVRMMSGGGGGYGGGGYGGGMGGGGFLSGLMGGMMGAVAGHYLYDNFFGGGSTASAADGSYGGDPGMADTGAGDYDGGASAGGDFGEGGDVGGGDFGGGDFGGGDFGGGDW